MPSRTRASASPLFVPRKSDRRTARTARSQFAAARDQARHASRPEARPTAPGLDPELRATYPVAGRSGPASARGGRLKLPAHRMTTATASGAYPFLAEGGWARRGSTSAVTSTRRRPSPTTRSPCTGVSTASPIPISCWPGSSAWASPPWPSPSRCAPWPSDTGSTFPVTRRASGPSSPGELGGQTIALGPGLPGRLNPLDAPARPYGVSEEDWTGEVRKRRLLLLGSLAKTVLGRELHPMEHTALDVALDEVVAYAEANGTTPLLGEVAYVLGSPERLDAALGELSGRLGHAAEDLAHALRRLVHGDLAGMFDAPSTVAFDPSAPMLSIDLSRLGGSGDDTALVLAMTCASAWMESALADPAGGRRWVIYDEAWRVMRHVALLERMQSQWKLSRGLGIANLMVIHRLSDLLAAGDAGSRGRASPRACSPTAPPGSSTARKLTNSPPPPPCWGSPASKPRPSPRSPRGAACGRSQADRSLLNIFCIRGSASCSTRTPGWRRSLVLDQSHRSGAGTTSRPQVFPPRALLGSPPFMPQQYTIRRVAHRLVQRYIRAIAANASHSYIPLATGPFGVLDESRRLDARQAPPPNEAVLRHG